VDANAVANVAVENRKFVLRYTSAYRRLEGVTRFPDIGIANCQRDGSNFVSTRGLLNVKAGVKSPAGLEVV
jgi:hypothetical protein